jgi:hypothetical protein
MLGVLPFMLLIPDMTINILQRAFFPSPADTLMRHYKNTSNRQDSSRNDTVGIKVKVTPANSEQA